MLVFEEKGKPKYPEKNLSEQRREPTTNSTHIMESSPGIDRQPHRWESSALTTKWLENENEIEIGLKLTVK